MRHRLLGNWCRRARRRGGLGGKRSPRLKNVTTLRGRFCSVPSSNQSPRSSTATRWILPRASRSRSTSTAARLRMAYSSSRWAAAARMVPRHCSRPSGLGFPRERKDLAGTILREGRRAFIPRTALVVENGFFLVHQTEFPDCGCLPTAGRAGALRTPTRRRFAIVAEFCAASVVVGSSAATTICGNRGASARRTSERVSPPMAGPSVAGSPGDGRHEDRRRTCRGGRRCSRSR